MVTLILVIAVKLAKQCTTHASPSGTSSSAASASSSAAPAAEYPAHVQGRGVCQAGFRPDQNGNCVKDF
jgi:hypothetical protein